MSLLFTCWFRHLHDLPSKSRAVQVYARRTRATQPTAVFLRKTTFYEMDRKQDDQAEPHASFYGVRSQILLCVLPIVQSRGPGQCLKSILPLRLSLLRCEGIPFQRQ